MAFSMNAIFGELGLKELVSLHLRKDVLSNLAKKLKSLKNLKPSWFKSLKKRSTFA